jgi:hypothetical protein
MKSAICIGVSDAVVLFKESIHLGTRTVFDLDNHDNHQIKCRYTGSSKKSEGRQDKISVLSSDLIRNLSLAFGATPADRAGQDRTGQWGDPKIVGRVVLVR